MRPLVATKSILQLDDGTGPQLAISDCIAVWYSKDFTCILPPSSEYAFAILKSRRDIGGVSWTNSIQVLASF